MSPSGKSAVDVGQLVWRACTDVEVTPWLYAEKGSSKNGHGHEQLLGRLK